jgi:hypothetical protein
MVGELSALQQIVTALTGLNGLAAVIVQCAVTTIYTGVLSKHGIISVLTQNSSGRLQGFVHYR